MADNLKDNQAQPAPRVYATPATMQALGSLAPFIQEHLPRMAGRSMLIVSAADVGKDEKGYYPLRPVAQEAEKALGKDLPSLSYEFDKDDGVGAQAYKKLATNGNMKHVFTGADVCVMTLPDMDKPPHIFVAKAAGYLNESMAQYFSPMVGSRDEWNAFILMHEGYHCQDDRPTVKSSLGQALFKESILQPMAEADADRGSFDYLKKTFKRSALADRETIMKDARTMAELGVPFTSSVATASYANPGNPSSVAYKLPNMIVFDNYLATDHITGPFDPAAPVGTPSLRQAFEGMARVNSATAYLLGTIRDDPSLEYKKTEYETDAAYEFKRMVFQGENQQAENPVRALAAFDVLNKRGIFSEDTPEGIFARRIGEAFNRTAPGLRQSSEYKETRAAIEKLPENVLKKAEYLAIEDSETLRALLQPLPSLAPRQP